MDVQFTPDQQAFIHDAIAEGRLQRPEDAVHEALQLWEERERRRLEILSAIDAAEESLAAGNGRTVTSDDETRRLAEDVKRRGRNRLDSEKNAGR